MVIPLIPAFIGITSRLAAPAAVRAVAGGAARVASSRVASTIAGGAARGITRSVVGGAATGAAGAMVGAATNRGQPQQLQSQDQSNPDGIATDVTAEVPQALQVQTNSTPAIRVAQSEGGNIGGKLTDSPLVSLLRSVDTNVKTIRQILEMQSTYTDDRTRVVRDREKDPSSGGISPIAGMLAGLGLSLLPIFQDFVENFRARIEGVVTSFGNGLNSVVNSIASVINSISETISNVFTSIGESISSFFGGLLSTASGAAARAEEQAEQGRSELTPRMADGAGNPGQAAAAAIGRSYTVPTAELGEITRMLAEAEPNETPEIAAARQAADEDFARLSNATPNGDITIDPNGQLGQYIEGRREREAMAAEAPNLMTPEQRSRVERENMVIQNNQRRVEAAQDEEANALTRWFGNARDVLTGRNIERSQEQARAQAEQARGEQSAQVRAAEMAEANARVAPVESYDVELQSTGGAAPEGDDEAMNRVLERLSSMTNAQQAPQVTVVQTPAAPPQVVPVPVGQNSNSPPAPGAGGPITTPRSHPNTMGEPPSPAAPRR